MPRKKRYRTQDRKQRLRVGFVSLGCSKNRVDSEAMLARLHESGCVIVTEAADADVIVVNTCAFIEAAKQESIRRILEMSRYKRRGQARRLVVTGCLAQRHDRELRRAIPEIDATLGTGQIESIERAVLGGRTTVSGSPGWLPRESFSRLVSTPSHLAYLKISEGCDYECSFCVIPSLRGRYRSRPIGSIVAEARQLTGLGVREIVLVAQDTTRYGLDLGLRDGLARLLRCLGKIEGLRWIRVMYAHPATLSDAILDAVASEDKVVKYIDLPLQHASESILSQMRRPTGQAYSTGLVEKMRARIPGLAIRTTFLVGFPGETEKDFAVLLRFVEWARFEHVGVFTFSREEGTAASDFRRQLPSATKERRRRDLMELQQSICLAGNRARVGQRAEVLIDEVPSLRSGVARGRLSTQAPEVDGSVLVTNKRVVPGTIVECEITDARPYDLIARLWIQGACGGAQTGLT